MVAVEEPIVHAAAPPCVGRIPWLLLLLLQIAVADRCEDEDAVQRPLVEARLLDQGQQHERRVHAERLQGAHVLPQ